MYLTSEQLRMLQERIDDKKISPDIRQKIQSTLEMYHGLKKNGLPGGDPQRRLEHYLTTVDELVLNTPTDVPREQSPEIGIAT